MGAPDRPPHAAGPEADADATLRHDFEESIGFWVFTAAHAIESAMNAELAGSGITFRQCQILGMLAAHGELSQAELAEKMRVEPSSVVRLLDRMGRDGWVERVPDPHDRRRNLVRTTPKAAPVWEEIRTRLAPIRDRAADGLDRADVARLIAMLRRIRGNLAGDDEAAYGLRAAAVPAPDANGRAANEHPAVASRRGP